MKPVAPATVEAPGALVIVDLVGHNVGGLTHENALPESYHKGLKKHYHTISDITTVSGSICAVLTL